MQVKARRPCSSTTNGTEIIKNLTHINIVLNIKITPRNFIDDLVLTLAPKL